MLWTIAIGFIVLWVLGLVTSCMLKGFIHILFVVAVVVVLVQFVQGQAAAQDGFSMGLVLGDPSGFTLREGLDERNAVQAHFGFSPFPGDAVAAMVDWTRDGGNFLPDNPSASLLFYYGVGGKIEWFTGNYYVYEYDHHHSFPDQTHFGLGVRGLAGLRTSFHKAPLDLFFELSPVGFLLVVPNPGTYYDLDFALGVRYRF